LQGDHALFEKAVGFNVDGGKICLEDWPRLQVVLQILSDTG